MTGRQAKEALQQSTPYLTLGNLVAMAALVVTMLQAGILDVSAGSDPADQEEVVALSEQVTSNTSSIGELRRINERQDTALAATQGRFGQRMDRVETKLDKIYRFLIDSKARNDEGPR